VSEREYLLVSGPDAAGHLVVEWSGTSLAEAKEQAVEHPLWVPWMIDPTVEPSAQLGWPSL
jgi:hypothetical protein